MQDLTPLFVVRIVRDPIVRYLGYTLCSAELFREDGDMRVFGMLQY
jgi:hypothetical protein